MDGFDLDVASVLDGKVLAELQAKAAALLVFGSVSRLAAAEQAGDAVFADTDAVVTDADAGKIAAARHGDVDGAVLVAELDGVAQEVAYHGVEHVRVGMDLQVFRSEIAVEPDMFRLGDYDEDVHDTENDVVDFKILIDDVEDRKSVV